MASSPPLLRLLMPWRKPQPTVAVVRLAGVIGGGGPFRRGLTLESLAPRLEAAFSDRRADVVALSINSPGGSAVQSDLIAGRIRALAAEKDKPVTAFCEDVAASGGYWLACAADEIYANASSIVGSIGVIAAGFGFTEALGRLGIERRLYAAGENKGMLDPFQPENPAHVERLKALQGEIHERFKAHVRARRGARLKGDEAERFSGAFWTGTRAKELGLVDDLGDLRGVMRARLGDKVRFRIYDERRPLLRRLGFATGDAAGLAEGLIAAAEERAAWARFGL
jgi:signal peptide peptidase SppA